MSSILENWANPRPFELRSSQSLKDAFALVQSEDCHWNRLKNTGEKIVCSIKLLSIALKHFTEIAMHGQYCTLAKKLEDLQLNLVSSCKRFKAIMNHNIKNPQKKQSFSGIFSEVVKYRTDESLKVVNELMSMDLQTKTDLFLLLSDCFDLFQVLNSETRIITIGKERINESNEIVLQTLEIACNPENIKAIVQSIKFRLFSYLELASSIALSMES